jgi:hypothetical protein
MEEEIKKAYEIYLTESRKEYDDLVSSGALVNYRKFSLEQFIEAGTNKENVWYQMFSKKFDLYLNKAQNDN